MPVYRLRILILYTKAFHDSDIPNWGPPTAGETRQISNPDSSLVHRCNLLLSVICVNNKSRLSLDSGSGLRNLCSWYHTTSSMLALHRFQRDGVI